MAALMSDDLFSAQLIRALGYAPLLARRHRAQIRCPTFVCGTDADDLSANAPRLYAALTCPNEYVEFAAADGAGAHCEGGARTAFHQRVFAWLDAVLDQERA